MKIRFLDDEYVICQISDVADVDMTAEFLFLGKTPDEISLVCLAKDAPAKAVKLNAQWRCLRIEGTLDFNLIGILANITQVLAASKVSVFTASTFNTDYILIKQHNAAAAKTALENAGYEILDI